MVPLLDMRLHCCEPIALRTQQFYQSFLAGQMQGADGDKGVTSGKDGGHALRHDVVAVCEQDFLEKVVVFLGQTVGHDFPQCGHDHADFTLKIERNRGFHGVFDVVAILGGGNQVANMEIKRKPVHRLKLFNCTFKTDDGSALILRFGNQIAVEEVCPFQLSLPFAFGQGQQAGDDPRLHLADGTQNDAARFELLVDLLQPILWQMRLQR